MALVPAVIRPRVSSTTGVVELELLPGAAGHISLQDRQRHTQFGLIAEKVAIQKVNALLEVAINNGMVEAPDQER